MTDEVPFELDRALYQRWRRVEAPSATLDPMRIAAYLDGELDEAAAEPIEAALAADPALLDLVLGVRDIVPEIPSVQTLRRAQNLVVPSAVVVPFRRQGAPVSWMRGVVAWGAVAASVAVISMVGFNLGFETEQAINAAPVGVSVDLLDQSATDGGVG